MAGKVYINNDLIWADQSLDEPLSRSWNTPRDWVLPASAIKEGENILWVYLVKAPAQESTLGEIHLGTFSEVQPFFQTYLLEQRTLISIGFIINSTVAIFYFMVWLIYRKESAYLWLFTTLAFWVFYTYLFLAYETPFSSINVDRLITWVFSTYTIVGCFGLWRFAHRRFPKIEKGLIALFLIVSMVLVSVPTQYLTQVFSYIFIINMIIFLLLRITYPFIAYQVKQIEVSVMAIIHLIFIPVALHDAYQILSSNTEFWSPYVAPLTALVMGILLGLRLYRNNKVIEAFNLKLSEKINTVTEELKTSLNDQHQLALQNMRLQERINLSHDLHDGLGGSLVRSMVLVDNNQDIDKDQFMSILKLLRNDLRQVIDQGSSINTQSPQTPILWASSIRRRFVQIFDELDIYSEWIIPEQWNKPLMPLESLTLTRVAEESLTNIIKHSHADKVYVRLIAGHTEIVLEIEDNGIGFDTEKVQTGLHVGLHSMQVRINRLGGKFKVFSKYGQTIIRVSL